MQMNRTGSNGHNFDFEVIVRSRRTGLRSEQLTILLSSPATGIDMVAAQSKRPLCIRSDEQE